uniref:Uncharacterized protein n=1 Tax=Tanacetum cinerariifolium TaxID=118510 RepID=A0A6L2LWX3_TANCI|nr:hypothetical protein [Tanacetum cinerariifolium]
MTNSGHSMVSYTSISSPKRSWDIPDVDPYEEAALQAIEHVAPPLSPAYLPDPIELDEHVPVYVPEPKYPEYLEPLADDIVTKDQPHADDEDLKEEDPKEEDPEEEVSDDNPTSKEEPSEGSDNTEPFEEDETAIPSPPLPVQSPPPMPSSPLPPPVLVETHAPEQDVAAALLILPSTNRRSEVGESSAATDARPSRDLYGFVDTTEAEASITRSHARTLHDTERKMMTVVELVNPRDLHRSEARNESLGAHNRSLVARIETIETRMTEMEDQFQDTRDRAVSHVICTQVLEARAQTDAMEDAGSSS